MTIFSCGAMATYNISFGFFALLFPAVRSAIAYFIARPMALFMLCSIVAYSFSYGCLSRILHSVPYSIDRFIVGSDHPEWLEMSAKGDLRGSTPAWGVLVGCFKVLSIRPRERLVFLCAANCVFSTRLGRFLPRIIAFVSVATQRRATLKRHR